MLLMKRWAKQLFQKKLIHKNIILCSLFVANGIVKIADAKDHLKVKEVTVILT